jgi:hypothetical protein
MSTPFMFCLPTPPIQTNPSQHPPRCSSPIQLSLFTWQHFATVLPHAALTSPHLVSPHLTSTNPYPSYTRPSDALRARRQQAPWSAVAQSQDSDTALCRIRGRGTPLLRHTHTHAQRYTQHLTYMQASAAGRTGGWGQVTGGQRGIDHTQRDVDGERRVTHGRRIGT